MSKQHKAENKMYIRSIQAYEWCADVTPPKKVKTYKKKSRQEGKRQIREDLKNEASKKAKRVRKTKGD